jgi:glycosyltransferase involved in cell wall biosynthesis
VIETSTSQFGLIPADGNAAAGAPGRDSGNVMAIAKRDTPKGEDVRIAVILPLYNGAPYIRQAIESVLNQSLPAAEIIVVDDGSTDDGPQLVENLAREHPIILLHKPNGGQGSARNFGAANSSSDLIALLDQDDVWYCNHLERLARPFLAARAVELGWAYSNADEIDEQGRLIVRSVLRLFDKVQHPKRDVHGCLRADMYVLPSASLISRKAFEAVGGFDESLRGYEDDDLFLRLFRAGYDNVYLDEALSQWRIFPRSSSYSPRMAVSRMLYLRKLLEEFPDEPARGRYWARDVLLPRFLPHLVAEFVDAVERRDRERMRTSLEDLRFASCHHNRRIRTVLKVVLALLRFPGAARALLAARPALLPLSRRILG